ncbi:MAG: ABC transporter substrate-binding protein [Lachnospiraceae bacterium]|nr:ABC transporter substrate-binding protein [Lachnospiraceae bacterium]
MKKKTVSILMAIAMVMAMTACGGTGSSETKETSTTASTAAEGSFTIGISQFAEHGSLDNCREGFLAGLAEEGIVDGENLTVLFDNAQADMGTASTISDNYVSQKVDLICAIATPSAMSAYNSCLKTEIPVIYTAVSDPVAAGLAGEDGASAGNVTGTSDALPVTNQLEMIREILPEAEKIGILYTTSETNSESTIAEYKRYAADYGFEIVESGINTIADVPMAAADLASRVDCITNLTDNTVVSALQTVLDAADKEGIPVFGSEVEQVKNGCVASMGLEYFELGKQTGVMAAKVLKGEAEASALPYEVITQASLYVNTAAADKAGLILDDEFVNRAHQKFDEIIVE